MDFVILLASYRSFGIIVYVVFSHKKTPEAVGGAWDRYGLTVTGPCAYFSQ